VVEAQAPDALALQEVDENMARSRRIAQSDWFARRIRANGLFAPAMEYDGGQYGIALLARLPIQSHERRLLYLPQYGDADQRPRHDSEQRVMLAATVLLASLSRPGSVGSDAGEGALKLIVTHLGLTPDQRSVQVQQLADFARSWHGSLPTVIMGDFNCEPDAPELAPMYEHFQDACAVCRLSGDARFTFPSGARGARCEDGWRGAIDYVWASPDVKICSAQVIFDESRASDHQPVVAEIEI
jgi:endonuclease/exonuclease/phosphatase family metal-dependent hydrolase